MNAIRIEGMSCQHCVDTVTKALTTVGLTEVVVDLDKKEASFQNDNNISEEEIAKVVADAGFSLEY